MSGTLGLSAEEQKIYDEFESASRAIVEKAKAEAAAIGKDVQDIIGPIQTTIVKEVKTVETWFERTLFWRAVRTSWRWLLTLTQFLDSPAQPGVGSKFSHKRLLALACFGTSVWFAVRGGWIPALVYLAGAVILAIISAVTKT